LQVFKKSSFKNYGLGLGLRKDLRKNILELKTGLINWLEIVPENYIYRGGITQKNFQEVLAKNIPLIPHGVNLSIGTAPENGFKVAYDEYLLRGLKELFSLINPPWFSDHISCTRINSIYLQDLIPVPRTNEAVSIISNNIKFLQDYFQLPFLIENPSYYSDLVEPELSESDFINKILEQADCGLLLDINNVFVNAINHNYDSINFINCLDLERLVQVHIAGHFENYKCWINNRVLGILDTHGHPIRKEVYDLLAYVSQKTEIKAVLLERDSNFGDFEAIVKELETIKAII
jgi:uncharacterized protein (UPF0276 family)